MSTTPTLREAAHMALSFIRWSQFGECRTAEWDLAPPSAYDADEALSAALAVPDEPVAHLKARTAVSREMAWEVCPKSDGNAIPVFAAPRPAPMDPVVSQYGNHELQALILAKLGAPAEPAKPLTIGDYVLATKYDDGDPGDGWALGFYAGPLGCAENGLQVRYMVVDATGANIRGNGFRRVARVRKDVGHWLLTIAAKQLEQSPPGTVNLWTMLTPAAFVVIDEQSKRPPNCGTTFSSCIIYDAPAHGIQGAKS